jgi:hypothetical protein
VDHLTLIDQDCTYREWLTPHPHQCYLLSGGFSYKKILKNIFSENFVTLALGIDKTNLV